MTLALSPIGQELLDDPGAEPGEVRLTLHHIARANRLFGGVRAARYGLARLRPPGSGPFTLLDVGTGQGDIPRALAGWADRRGTPFRAVGLDRIPAAAQLASHKGQPTVIGCGGQLPFRSGSVDLVLASQLAHHLAPDACCQLFRECGRVARLGVVIADLRRSWLARPLFAGAARLLRFDRWTREDGVVSLARGFTRQQLLARLAEAGVQGKVTRRGMVRIVAWWRVGP